MESSVVTALAALIGAAIGALASVITSWLTQKAQARAQGLAHSRARREELYKEFVENSSRVYLHALQNREADLAALMELYAELSRMRVLSAAAVVDSADKILKKIIETYLEPNKNFPELRQMVNSGMIDPLREFSVACREEFRSSNSPFDQQPAE
jgi:hypothetical protein